MLLSNALGYKMEYSHPSEIMDEIASLTPSFTGVSYAKLDELGSVQWPCNEKAPLGTPMMHVDRFVRGARVVHDHRVRGHRGADGGEVPADPHHGPILSQYNVARRPGAENSRWHEEDVLEIHPFDAELRGIVDGDLVALESRSGDIALKAKISERMQPGVVYTTFHHAKTGANVITTDYSDLGDQLPRVQGDGGAGPTTGRPTGRRSSTRRLLPDPDRNSQGTALDAAE